MGSILMVCEKNSIKGFSSPYVSTRALVTPQKVFKLKPESKTLNGLQSPITTLIERE